MSEPKPGPGSIGWVDLTIGPAESIRDFYAAVVGWKPEPVDMGGYADFVMNDPVSGEAKAGVCNQRGRNAGLPTCWLVYFVVADLGASLARCRELGGRVLADRRGDGGFCVIEDPSGAICAISRPPS